MIFQRGFRLRTELYSKSFHNGIVKTTNVILSTIQTLNFCGHETNPKKIIPDGESIFFLSKRRNGFSSPSFPFQFLGER